MQQKEEPLRARSMGKSELALAYAPELTPHSAVKRLMKWLSINPALMDALRQTHYYPTQKVLTARQVQLIFDYLGEPLKRKYR